MQSLKFSLGPFEIFAAIMGGIPLLLAGFLLYTPVGSLQDLALLGFYFAAVGRKVISK